MLDRLTKEVDILQRHLEILQEVNENEPIGIVRISKKVDLRHHKVRYSMRRLEEERLIEPTKQGAVTTDQTANYIVEIDEKLDDIRKNLNNMVK